MTASIAAMARTSPIPADADEYDHYIESMRQTEHPMLNDSIYLDHAGTTLYSMTQMDRFHADMMASLYGNPHSASPSSQRSTQEIEDVRLRLLKFFNADPEHFDLVFTANATASIKLVVDAFREAEGGFEYAYHLDSHTSLVGVRELATTHQCFQTNVQTEKWINRTTEDSMYRLFAFPAQSNMNGRRLPMDWCRRVRCSGNSNRTYTLLDAAAYASTSPLRPTSPL
jgi:molybdenum cofactor sulfurtransferase